MTSYQKIDFSRWEILKDLDYSPWNESVLVHVYSKLCISHFYFLSIVTLLKLFQGLAQ